MSPERLARFLYFFYKGYLRQSFIDGKALNESHGEIGLDEFDVLSYLQKNVDIYVQHTEMDKDYAALYNTKLFYSDKTKEPELFNELEIFLIENFQLFCHTILQAVLQKKFPDLVRLDLKFRPIDNKEVHLLPLVEDAENS